MKESYQVEGIHYDTYDSAKVVADRLYARNKKSQTILIYGVNHHGEKVVVETLTAIKEDKSRCPDTLDMFGDL